MGVANFLLLCTGIPFIYTAAIAIVFYERVHGSILLIQSELIYLSEVTADKYPVVILVTSIALWYIDSTECE